MSVLIKDMEMPKNCYECKLDLRTDVCPAFDEWHKENPYSIPSNCRLTDCPLEEVPESDDAVPRTSIEYICRKNTVSTNPYKHKYHDKFIEFMDDPEIADFGRWQHSNGFNTALVAVKCDLDKVSSFTPKSEQRWIPCSERLPEENMWTICQNNAGAMMIGKYDIEFGWMFPAYFDGTVAWMPLPEQYREEEDMKANK